MRIGLFSPKFLTSAALSSAMTLAMAGAAGAQQAATDTGAAVNQASPVTEKILQELRASKSEPDLSPTGPAVVLPATSAASSIAVPTPPAETDSPKQDGSLDVPASEPANTDGQLGTQQETAPVDGDISGDGKLLATPAEASQDPLVQQQPATVNPIRLPATAAPRRDARSAAGRPRGGADDQAPGRRRAVPVETVNDAAIPDGGPNAGSDADADVAAVPILRTQDDEEDGETPYAPVGYKIGSFTLMPSITAETVYSDNVRQSNLTPQGDTALVLRPAFTLESEWSRHFVSVDLRGMTSKYARLSDENNRELTVNANGRLDIREGTTLDGEATFELGKVPHSDPNLPAEATMRPSSTTATLGAGINQQINRLALRLHGSVADSDQGDSGGGAIKFRDTTLDTRAGFEVSPSLTLVGTAKRVGRHFNDAGGTDAVANDARLGLETDPSAKLSGAFNAGLAQVASANPALDSARGLVGSANIIWLPSALTTLTFAAASDLSVTDAAGATAIRTNKVGLDVRHDFRRWLSMTAGISETRRSYPGLELTETERSGHVGMEYNLNRTVVLTGDFKRTTLASTDTAKDYAEDQVMVGVRLQK